MEFSFRLANDLYFKTCNNSVCRLRMSLFWRSINVLAEIRE